MDWKIGLLNCYLDAGEAVFLTRVKGMSREDLLSFIVFLLSEINSAGEDDVLIHNAKKALSVVLQSEQESV